MSISYLPIVATLALLVLAIAVISFALRYQKRQLENFQEKQFLKATFEQETLKSQIEIQNQTLQSIGQELHDNIGQILSLAKLNMDILEETLPVPAAQPYIMQTSELIDQAIQDLRELSKSLDEDYVQDFGLQQSIAHELQRISRTKRFNAELLVDGEPTSLGQKREIVLFRVVQELLNNAIKHSKASQLIVALSYTSIQFNLSVSDNGVGFDWTSVQQSETKGSGIRNIQRRINLIGGTCQWKATPGEGTRISIAIPLGIE
ncbi:sensor histidine kinase [Spirosoma foliorum]|uniref:Oxygen sensor histidine kinase NreB n=1 Tax=Spirosoma foliorum TaxID=2710596 RepID=A0A7G5GRK3_9BACT|nr:ATP-binding protein [Spirosoma foliorum]QMW01495.1 sensor histidine kinase [Spirosoma foliorum]